MKITQAKNYKKPLYAIGLATAIMAAAVSGCTDPGKGPDYAGGMDVRPTETTEVELAGDVAMEPEETTSDTEKPLITDGILPNDVD